MTRGERQKDTTDAYRKGWDAVWGRARLVYETTCKECGFRTEGQDTVECARCGRPFGKWHHKAFLWR